MPAATSKSPRKKRQPAPEVQAPPAPAATPEPAPPVKKKLGRPRKYPEGQSPWTDGAPDPRRGSRHVSRNMVRIDDARYEKLRQAAAAENRPISYQLASILDAFFRQAGI